MECTVKEYIQSKASLDLKIAAITSLIDNMLLSAIDAIDTSGTASYSMDDGQMKVTTEYRSIEQITKGILALEKIQQVYINRRNGYVTVLRSRLNY
jgi:hypothetical protein